MKRMKPGDSILLLKQTKLTNLISEHCQLSGQDDYRKFILVENCKIFFRSKKTGINFNKRFKLTLIDNLKRTLDVKDLEF